MDKEASLSMCHWLAGTKNLPKHCVEISAIVFFVSILLPIFRDFGPAKLARFTPVPMAMGIPLVVGAW